LTTTPNLPAAAADWLLARLAERPGALAIALSGGSTPKKLYELLATPAYAARIPWERLHLFWGDERFVPPDDPSSNYRMTKTALLDHVPIPADHIHPIPTTDLTHDQSAAQYEQTLKRFHGSSDLSQPLFHIVLNGLGTNGHFASLFPDTGSLSERTAWAVPVTPAGEKTRITLTYPALESCRHAAFLVSGPDKADVLARVRAGAPDLPASHYHPSGTFTWLTDDAAEGK
jgi:6-phosphogluconolactonase